MGMPQYPNRECKPQVDEIVLGLIEAVSVETLALAHILNAEGEKLQEIIRKLAKCNIEFYEFNKMCKNTHAMINSVIMKEWIMLNKIYAACDIYDVISFENNEKDKDEPHPCHKPHNKCNCCK